MSYKSDQGFRADLWQNAVSGLPHDLVSKAHQHLGKYYSEEKDSMSYDELLTVVKEFMSDYSQEWSWNSPRWSQR